MADITIHQPRTIGLRYQGPKTDCFELHFYGGKDDHVIMFLSLNEVHNLFDKGQAADVVYDLAMGKLGGDDKSKWSTEMTTAGIIRKV